MAVTPLQLNQLYLAYFGRPPDFGGFNFYLSNPGSTLNTVAAAFAASPESQALFGGDATTQVIAIYNNLFNRNPELAGLTYWVQQIGSGALSAPQAAIQILNSALTEAADSTDRKSVENKTAASQSFFNLLGDGTNDIVEIKGYSGLAANDTARAFLGTVTSDPATLTAAQAGAQTALNNAIATGSSTPGQTFTLTTGVDNVPGTSGNDTINATDATAGGLDVINGGAGTDTLNYNDTGDNDNPGAMTVSGVENVIARSAAGATIDTSNWTGVNNLSVTQGSSATVTAAGTTAVSVSGITGDVAVDGGSSVGIASAKADANITVGANTVSTGTVTVSHTKEGTGAIQVDGGTDVTVTAGAVSTGTIKIGQGGATTDLPSGNVTVTSTGAKYAAGTAVTLGAIDIKGGTSVVVNQTATSDSSAAAKDAGAVGSERTMSAVTVTGGSATTTVSVTQTAAVAAKNAVDAVAGAQETQTITFGAMAKDETLTINGLTFTAAKALTAAQVAAAFSNVANGATVGAGGSANGTYSGTFNDGGLAIEGSTGAVVPSGTKFTVVFTSKDKADVGTLAIGGTAAGTSVTSEVNGSASQDGVTGVMGVIDGAVAVDGNITGTDVLASVTLDGYGALSTVKSEALTTLNLAHSNSDVTVTNATASTLALGLNGVGIKGTTAAVDLGGTYTALNVFDSTADSFVVLAGADKVTALTVGGDHAVDFTGSNLSAVKTVVVSGSAGLKLDATPAGTLTSVDTTGTTGTVTAQIDPAKATYTGGAGVDKVTTTLTVVSKAISLGAGNDSLTLASGTTTLGAAINGGDGTDTLVMAAADAVTATATNVFATKVSGFEKLSLGAIGADGAVDLANMNSISDVITAGGTNILTLDHMAAGGTVEFTAAATDTIVNLTDATGTTDSLNVSTTVKDANVNFGILETPDVESLSITATDSDTSTDTGAGVNTATLTLLDAALKTVTVTGSSNLTLNLDVSVTALTSLDASGLTGKLTASTNGTVAETITGGSGKDVLTATGKGDTLIGNAGNDTLNGNGDLATLTGGAGSDKFVIDSAAHVPTNVNSYDTITDFSAGDVIQLDAAAVTFKASAVVLGATAVFQDYANAAITTTDPGDVAWFQFGGDTYIIENVSDSATAFQNGTDMVVKLAGLIDLGAHGAFSSSANTLTAI